jgi:hypothetical protein
MVAAQNYCAYVLLLLTSFAQLLVPVCSVSINNRQLRRHVSSVDNETESSFVRQVAFDHRLRVCNAYPLNVSMDIFLDASKRLTEDSPLPYKACRDFETSLNPGDKLDFKVGEVTTGTFSISSLPNTDAILLLVIHRHDAASTSVAFESHVYGNLASAQVAVIDTYKGADAVTTFPRIQDRAEVGAKAPRSEELRYNSVVAVSEGMYNVMLSDKNGTQRSQGDLVALGRECYVVMRTGVEGSMGQQAFPEELVVFPHSNPEMLHSGGQAAATIGFASKLAAVLAVVLAYGSLV